MDLMNWYNHRLNGSSSGTWTFRTLDYSYPLGLFVPWTVRTLLDCSYHGLFVPSLDDSYRDARLAKINVSYQNVPFQCESNPPEFF